MRMEAWGLRGDAGSESPRWTSYRIRHQRGIGIREYYLLMPDLNVLVYLQSAHQVCTK